MPAAVNVLWKHMQMISTLQTIVEFSTILDKSN